MPDKAVFVEGRVRINGDDAEAFEWLGKLHNACAALGLHVHEIEVDRDDLSKVRRTWGIERVSLAVALGTIRDYPGITFLKWTEVLFVPVGQMNETMFAAAKAKAKMTLSRLWRAGDVRKEKNSYGQLILYATVGGNAHAPTSLPGDFLAQVDEDVAAAIKQAHETGKSISTRAIAHSVAKMVWERRVAYDKQ